MSDSEVIGIVERPLRRMPLDSVQADTSSMILRMPVSRSFIEDVVAIYRTELVDEAAAFAAAGSLSTPGYLVGGDDGQLARPVEVRFAGDRSFGITVADGDVSYSGGLFGPATMVLACGHESRLAMLDAIFAAYPSDTHAPDGIDRLVSSIASVCALKLVTEGSAEPADVRSLRNVAMALCRRHPGIMEQYVSDMNNSLSVSRRVLLATLLRESQLERFVVRRHPSQLERPRL